MQDGWSDAAMSQGLRERNPQALEALITRYSREIAYFVKTVLEGVGTTQDVEECVNDLFVTVWQEIASFNPERAALRTWVTMRAKYVALDRRRQIQRRLGGAAQVGQARTRGVEVESLATVMPLSSDISMEGMFEAREQREQLRIALELLPELDRLLVYLRYFKLATTEEIEARTGLTRRAIDTRLWRARRTLREELEVLEERSHGRVRAL